MSQDFGPKIRDECSKIRREEQQSQEFDSQSSTSHEMAVDENNKG